MPTDEVVLRRRPRLVAGVLWLTPLALGLAGVVLLRVRIDAVGDGGLDSGDRIFLLAAVLLLPLSCYLVSALMLLISSRRQLTDRYRVCWVAFGSALAVIVWLLALGRR
jgi:uncharacterized BrkB/YihY/UPF0761 family membrane protein